MSEAGSAERSRPIREPAQGGKGLLVRGALAHGWDALDRTAQLLQGEGVFAQLAWQQASRNCTIAVSPCSPASRSRVSAAVAQSPLRIAS